MQASNELGVGWVVNHSRYKIRVAKMPNYSKSFLWGIDTVRADTSHIYYNSVTSIIAGAHFSINRKHCEQDSVGGIRGR